jgi:hypothetical protein
MEQKSLENIESYLTEAIKNIRDDRAITSKLLSELVVEIQKQSAEYTHKSLGLIAAKYVETLQRSNEQLVKITSILNKGSSADQKLTAEDKSELFDIIQDNKK